MMTEQQAVEKARRLSINCEGPIIVWWDEDAGRYRVGDEFDFGCDFNEEEGDEEVAVFEDGTATASGAI